MNETQNNIKEQIAFILRLLRRATENKKIKNTNQNLKMERKAKNKNIKNSTDSVRARQKSACGGKGAACSSQG
jgi:hypothetical protein